MSQSSSPVFNSTKIAEQAEHTAALAHASLKAKLEKEPSPSSDSEISHPGLPGHTQGHFEKSMEEQHSNTNGDKSPKQKKKEQGANQSYIRPTHTFKDKTLKNETGEEFPALSPSSAPRQQFFRPPRKQTQKEDGSQEGSNQLQTSNKSSSLPAFDPDSEEASGLSGLEDQEAANFSTAQESEDDSLEQYERETAKRAFEQEQQNQILEQGLAADLAEMNMQDATASDAKTLTEDGDGDPALGPLETVDEIWLINILKFW